MRHGSGYAVNGKHLGMRASRTHPKRHVRNIRRQNGVSTYGVAMKTILVMDEDAAVRESLCSVLRDYEYDVVLATDSLTALDAYDSVRIDLLLLDATLPLRHGWDAYKRFASRHPQLPIILLDGHAGRVRMPVPAGIRIFLNKPFDAPSLLGAIRGLLEEADADQPASPGSASRDSRIKADPARVEPSPKSKREPASQSAELRSLPNPST